MKSLVKPQRQRGARLHTLDNGVRVLLIPETGSATAHVSVFVRSGSAHESRARSGLSHVLEHMVFKGTHTRDCHRINLDAERLGAEVNAHTDKDHTAFHMSGLAEHAPRFVRMLADLVQHARFPADELEREREVVLQEVAEFEDDALSSAYKMFDSLCYGTHPVAQPVIGSRRNIENFTSADLADWVARGYTGSNVVVAVLGAANEREIVAAVSASFAAMPQGQPNDLAAPTYVGGLRAKRQAGNSQTHVVLGFPIPALAADDAAAEVAAALLGEGMSSPLMSELRERRGLVYYAGCSAEVGALCGQFTIEASVAPDKLDELLQTVMELLRAQAQQVGRVDLARARNQIAVRRLRLAERPARRLEDAALDLLALGHVRMPEQRLADLQAVGAARVRRVFERGLAGGVTLAMSGCVGRAAKERARQILGDDLASCAA